MPGNESSEGFQIVVPCSSLEPTMRFLINQLDFRLDMIMPADAPRIALVSGHGIHLRLEQTTRQSSALLTTTLRLPHALKERYGSSADAAEQINIIFGEPPSTELSAMQVDQAIVCRPGEDGNWGAGRAGMQYRDLIPCRLDGSVIASHIRIIEGGPVDDYVHYHKVGVQLIYCRRGWVRVVYEDQGEPFVMQAGDCVLQPPTIRHRVLESSAGLEVIELGSPAEHETWRDHELTLPTPSINPTRTFEGQHFVRHIAAESEWRQLGEGISFRETGIGAATQGKAGLRVVKLAGTPEKPITHSAQTDEFRFVFVLDGHVELADCSDDPIAVATDDACVLPSRRPYSLRTMASTEVLEISFPAA